MDFSTTEGTNVAEKWRKWKQTMELYLTLSMTGKSEKEKCGAFLYIIGQAGRDVYNTMTFSDEEKDKIAVLFTKFESYCKPKQNVTIERYRFNTRVQDDSETIDQYVTELKLISKNCSYGELEAQLIRDRIVCGVKSDAIRQRLLRTDDLTLEQAVKICRADEQSKKHAQYLTEEATESVHGLRTRQTRGGKDTTVLKQAYNYNQPNECCQKCGLKHTRKQCPAYGKQCLNCGKYNHFAKFCKSRRKVQMVEQATNIGELCDDDDELSVSESEVLVIDAVKKHGPTEVVADQCFSTIECEGVRMKFKIDTGSQANIIPVKLFNSLSQQPVVKKCATRLTSYTGEDLCVRGQCVLQCCGQSLPFFVVETNQDPVLGLKASQELNIIKIVHNVTQLTDQYITKYPKVFSGLGCFSKPYHIKVDPRVQPVITPVRNHPVALRDRLKETLDEMEKMNVIRKVDQPTEWVSSLVVVEKPKTKKLRICLDPRPLNQAIQREHFKIPTLDDIATRLNGATVFSKLDANHGYWQVPLDKTSQLLTTFNSPFGRYCFMRMPFGIKSAQEVFQKRISQMFGDLPGVETDIDDILVWGVNAEEHEQRLNAVLKRCEDIHLTLNKEKCQFGLSEVTYIGHRLTPQGVHPDPEKVKAIREMPPPTDKKGVERLLGTINYLAKFIPNMSTVTQPIRELLKKDNVFDWQSPQKHAFVKIKEILSAAPVLTFYDVAKPVVITCDASKSGLGALLLQEGKPVAYASRALSDAETRYAQIEKELLAVVFAFSKFHQYVYGKDVVVESDHKPLEMIAKKALAAAPPRLQRMLLRLQQYSFQLQFKPGKDMVLADTLSRAFISDGGDDELERELECAVHLVVSAAPITDAKLNQLRQELSKDDSMGTLCSTIRDGWPNKVSQVPKEIREFWNFRDELTEANGLILKGGKLVIPPTMRNEILNKVHVSHLGIVKCKQRARDVVFWPGMGKQIEEMISKCDTCQEYRASNSKEPMIVGQIPTRPWEMVATDLFIWNGSDYLVVVDYYSRFFEVAKLSDTKSKTVVTNSKAIFARHGIPCVVRSDNGPQYSANEYKQFSTQWGFTHVTTSPYHSQSNGLAEKTVQTAKRLLNKAKKEGVDPYLALLEYRNTSVDNIGSPAQLCMSRRLRSTLPNTPEQLTPSIVEPRKVIQQLEHQQSLRKAQYDKGSRPLSSLQPREAVRLQVQDHWVPATVVQATETPRSYIVQTPDGRTYRRNRRHLIQSSLPESRSDHPSDAIECDADSSDEPEVAPESTDVPAELTVTRTSSGRVVKAPARYNDFVKT